MDIQEDLVFKCKLPTPIELKEEMPLSREVIRKKEEVDEQVRRVFDGTSTKKVLIIGPCSADSAEPVLEYCHRLQKIQDTVKDKLILIPRIYTQKPRTNGTGYMGLMHSPDLKTEDLFEGIRAVRALHKSVLEETGFGTADEMLYPEEVRYVSDILSYVAVGARSTENQNHRLAASGLSCPVGMKNPTSGSLPVMVNSIIAASKPHRFIYRGWDVTSKGNPLAHAILRGYNTRDLTKCKQNYHIEDLAECEKLLFENGVNQSIVVDCSHANSNKDFKEQGRIALEVLSSMKQRPSLATNVKGFMIESYLKDGKQGMDGSEKGLSYTDPCIGWDKTVDVIGDIYNAL